MKNYLFFRCLVFSAAVMLVLSGCPPIDGADIENSNNGDRNGDDGIEYVEVKNIIFDNLSVFTATPNPPNGVINDYQLGGEAGPTVELSSEQNHTEGEGGKSLKWSNRTYKYQRIKFDEIFSATDNGRMFNISMWVYTDTTTTVQLGTYRISGANVGDATTPVNTKTFEITSGWNELVWNGYEHTDNTVTQLAIEQPNSAASVVAAFYIDDIVIKASKVPGDEPEDVAVPENLEATAGDTTIDLSWNAVSGAAKYQVQYGTGDAFNLSSSKLTGTTHHITSLTNGETYNLKVRAGNDTGVWSEYSAPVTATPVAAETAPSAPAISSVVNDTEGQLTVTWASVSGAANYRYAYDTTDNEPSSGTETADLTAAITGLEDSTLYYVWVAAGNSAGWSSWIKSTGTTKTPAGYTEIKRIVFDNLTAFRVTNNPPDGTGKDAVYDWQAGGGAQAGDVALSTEKDHTTGSGKSLKWTGRTAKAHRIKFDKIFSAADTGRTFNISVWVYTDTSTTVQLGAYRVSEADVGDGTTASSSKTFEITTGWNELVWNDYVHTTDKTFTQLAIEQPGSAADVIATFYVDDIVVKTPVVDEPVVVAIGFDDLNAFTVTANPPEGGAINDWQAGGGTGAGDVTLSTEQDHTTGSGKSLKWSGRSSASYRVKIDKIFSAADSGKTFNAGMWVYTETATWIQLSVYRVSGPTYTSGKDGSAVIQRQLFRVEPGWNELAWRGYVHTDTEGTQLGIEQQGAETAVSTFYIDDILVTKAAD